MFSRATFGVALLFAASCSGEGAPTERADVASVQLGLCANPLRSFDAVYAAVAANLAAAPAADRRYMRYVSLSNRFNAGVCSADLAEDRLALNKLVNSLSTLPTLRLATSIGSSNTLYRIDIRHYSWNRRMIVNGRQYANGWEAIIDATPFAVEFVGDDADDAKALALTKVPVLSLDALTAAASQGNLYYSLASVSSSRNTLFTNLGVNPAVRYDTSSTLRVGTADSAQSRGDVLMQRDRAPAAPFRVIWETSLNTQNLFQNPVDFMAGERMVIYPLPNGLLAYGIFNSAGSRIVETNMILDFQTASFRVSNAVSCMGCHNQGVIAATDQVRQFALANAVALALTNDEVEDIRDVYKIASDVSATFQADRAAFATSLQNVGVSASARDPISAVNDRFGVALRLADAAGDLHVSSAELSAHLNDLDPALGVLATGSLARSTWAQHYVSALCTLSIASENQPSPTECAAAP